MRTPPFHHLLALFQAASSLCLAAPAATEADSFPVSITVRADLPRGEWRPIWRFFGYDEPNFTYMNDGQKLLTELGLLAPATTVFIRTHHLLTSGDGTPGLKWGSTGIYTEDPQGRSIYDFRIVDRIFDTYLQRGLKPLVQLGFMPEALSIHPQDYPRQPAPNQLVWPGVGFSYPPKDYAKWGELCRQWARHCVEKYGRAEVEQWMWEVWNEPNISYWKGTPQQYRRLYDHAVDGVRRALPTARVGGPHTAGGPGGRFLPGFLEHCLRGTNYATGQVGSPLDFIAFHAKGSPVFTNGHVRMGLAAQLRNVHDGFACVASFPELKGKPVLIGESDPEGCAACQGPQLGYRNGTMYSSYTAASFARKLELADLHGVNFLGALTWAFEFENQPYFAGFRALASNGLDLPVLNVFRMLARLGGQRLAVASSADRGVEALRREGVRGGPDVAALATLEADKVSVLAWHYHDDDVPGPEAALALNLTGLPAHARQAVVTHHRIDAHHSNAYEAWKRLGSPQQPTPEQYGQLEKAGQLAQLGVSTTLFVTNGHAALQLTLPRQAVSLLEIRLRSD
jgi:xylan 1,4-beta-xylosidase